jgi:hypothetical protein
MRFEPSSVGPWSSEELGVLRSRVHQGGHRKTVCADVAKSIGRSEKAVHAKMYVEGLVASGPGLVTRKIVSDGQSRDGCAPFDLGAGDALYIAVCLRMGGFASSVRLNDGRVIFGHRGKAWVQP